MPNALYIAAAGYIAGSIPFGYILVFLFRGEDVRKSGSGNIGATNVARKSPALGILTLLLDALKGCASVALGLIFSPVLFGHVSLPHIPCRMILPATSPELATWAALAALFAILGHMFPVWLKFRGGKGVATGLGAFAVIAPKAVLVAVIVFVGVVLVFRYVSLGSIVAVALFPTLAWSFHEFGGQLPALIMMSLASLAIVLKHHENIHRLLSGTEHRIGSTQAVDQRNQ